MAGIAGWAFWDEQPELKRSILATMMDRLAHRGREVRGWWSGRKAALAYGGGGPDGLGLTEGVVQAAAGHYGPPVPPPSPPAWADDGENGVSLIIDGQLHNLRQAAASLGGDAGGKGAGHARGGTGGAPPGGPTPAGVAARILDRWGPEGLGRLRGGYALAAWDDKSQRLILARDPLGAKPLFFARIGPAVVFGSEIKALLAHPLVKPEINNEGLAALWLIGPARTPGFGVFRQVEEVLPGHCVIAGPEGVTMKPYWRLSHRPHPHSPEETAHRIQTMLEDIIASQLPERGPGSGSSPVGILLSGGLDSSGLTALAARIHRRRGWDPVSTFSVSHAGDEKHFTASAFQPDADGPWVETVSAHLGTDHEDISINPEMLAEALFRAMTARDLPGMADVDSSLYLFSAELAARVSTVITGEGADEIFGGYPWFHRPDRLQADTFPWSIHPEERVKLMHPDLVEKIKPYEFLADAYGAALGKVPPVDGSSGAGSGAVHGAGAPPGAHGGAGPGPENGALPSGGGGQSRGKNGMHQDGLAASPRRLWEMSYLNLFYWLPTLLERQDRMAMASGLRTCLPFADHRLVEYAWNIPWPMKFAGGQPKGILREAFRKFLPAGVLDRRKSPYPKTHNPAYDGAVRRKLQSILADPGAPLRDLIDEEAAARLAGTGPEEKSRPWFGQLMAGPQMLAYLIQFNMWLKEYKVKIV